MLIGREIGKSPDKSGPPSRTWSRSPTIRLARRRSRDGSKPAPSVGAIRVGSEMLKLSNPAGDFPGAHPAFRSGSAATPLFPGKCSRRRFTRFQCVASRSGFPWFLRNRPQNNLASQAADVWINPVNWPSLSFKITSRPLSRN